MAILQDITVLYITTYGYICICDIINEETEQGINKTDRQMDGDKNSLSENWDIS